MNCVQCGTANVAGVRFCARCGRVLTLSQPGQAAVGLPAGLAAPPDPPFSSQLRAALHGLWDRHTAGQHKLLWIGLFLLVTGFLAVFGYRRLGPGEAALAALVFTWAWAGLFVAGPLLFRNLVWLVALSFVTVMLWLALALRLDPLSTLVYGAMLLLALGLGLALLPLVPGLAAGLVAYQVLGEGTLGIVGAVLANAAVLALLVVVWAALTGYVLPYARGYLWSVVAGLAAHRLTLSLVTGSHALELGQALRGVAVRLGAWLSEGATPGSAVAALTQAGEVLNALLLLDALPQVLWLWIAVVAFVAGLAAVAARLEQRA